MPDETMSVPAKLNRPPTPPISAAQASKMTISLDDAATTLLHYLPPPMVELIDSLCKEHRLKPAAYLLSYCRLAYERGEVATRVAEDEALRADTGEPISLFAGPSQHDCAYCHKPFTMARAGQRFCPDPNDGSPSCGRKSTLETMHAGREHYLRKTRPEREQINKVAAPRFAAETPTT